MDILPNNQYFKFIHIRFRHQNNQSTIFVAYHRTEEEQK